MIDQTRQTRYTQSCDHTFMRYIDDFYVSNPCSALKVKCKFFLLIRGVSVFVALQQRGKTGHEECLLRIVIWSGIWSRLRRCCHYKAVYHLTARFGNRLHALFRDLIYSSWRFGWNGNVEFIKILVMGGIKMQEVLGPVWENFRNFKQN